jgi:ribonuclease T2
VRVPKRFENPTDMLFVSPDKLLAEFLQANPGLKPDMVAINCGGGGNRLRDVRICMTKSGRPRPCGPNENRRALCQAREVLVPPVRSRNAERGSPRALRDLPSPRVIEGPGAL